MLDLVGFDERVRDVDLVITGEGNMDEQSAAGKAPVGVARRAKRYGKPVAAVVGGRAVNLGAVYEQGIDLVLPVCRKPMSLDQALNPQEPQPTSSAPAKRPLDPTTLAVSKTHPLDKLR